MEAIRTKDKIFLAVVLTAVLVGAYVYFWRRGAVRQIGMLSREVASLVAVADFPLEKGRAERQLAEARAERTAEERLPPPVVRIKAKPGESVAARERAVLESFRAMGLTLTDGMNAETTDLRGGEILRNTGCVPAPICRVYSLSGKYAALLGFLRQLDEKERAVLPEGVEMVRPGVWSLKLWL